MQEQMTQTPMTSTHHKQHIHDTATTSTASAVTTDDDVTFDLLLYLAHCHDAALMGIVLLVRLLLLCLMLVAHRVLPRLFGLSTMTFDMGELLYDDRRLSEVRNWDGVHFFHIAQYGYTHDNLYAFFPLVPLLIRGVTWLTTRAVPLLHRLAPVSFYMCMLHISASCVAAVVLRRLTALTFVDTHACSNKNNKHDNNNKHNNDYDSDDDCGRGALHACTMLDRFPTLDAWIADEAACVVRNVRLQQRCNRNDKDSDNDDDDDDDDKHSGERADDACTCAAQRVLRERVVGGAVLLWIATPAMVFTVAVYTEGFFSLLLFLGAYCMARSSNSNDNNERDKEAAVCVHEVCATLCFATAAMARSNGVVCVGFLLYPLLLRVCFRREYTHRLRYHSHNNSNDEDINKDKDTYKSVVHDTPPRRWPRPTRVLVLALECALVLLPYLAVNYDGWCRFVPLWSAQERAHIGAQFWRLYAVLQARYWNVGFLTAYTVPNLPNLIIALPMACTVTLTSVCFVLRPSLALWLRRCRCRRRVHDKDTTRMQRLRDACNDAARAAYALAELLVLSCNVVYLLVLAFIAFTLMHVQVSNRFLMSCPALYWLGGCQLALRPLHLLTRALLVFSVSWAVMGALLFANHMPWT